MINNIRNHIYNGDAKRYALGNQICDCGHDYEGIKRLLVVTAESANKNNEGGMTKMKKLFSLILVLCLTACVPCMFAEEELNYDFSIGFSSLGNYNNFWVNVNESLVKACEEKGIKLNWTIDDRDASKMKTAIETFVMQGVDIIVDGTVLTETGTAIAKELKKDNIPMLSIDCLYEDCYFFGINNGAVGNTIGEFSKNWIENNWDGKLDAIQVLFNEANGEENKLRVSNAANMLIDAGIVNADNVIYTNINSSGATVTDVSYVRSLVVDYLTSHPNDKKILVIAQTDDQGTAANSAVQASNRTDEVAIVSINCDTAVVKMLQEKSGSIIGTFNANPSGYGDQIVEVCAQILAARAAGKEVGPIFNNKGVVVSRENVWEYFPEKIKD